MEELLKSLLAELKRAGADYADARYEHRNSQGIEVRNGQMAGLTENEEEGVGFRVLYRGAFGFAGTSRLNEKELRRAAETALGIARASALVTTNPVEFAPAPVIEDTYVTPIEIDPFEVKVEDKLNLMFDAEAALHVDEQVRVGTASMEARRQEKVFVTTEGTNIHQTMTETGAGISAIAVQNGEMQQRSYPTSFGGDYATRGYENILDMDLVGQAPQCGQEAVDLLSAPQFPSGKADIILHGNQLALQIHESCGHPVELDRVLGMEASFAGTSFLTPEKLNNYTYGSEQVNITADATLKGGLGTFGYDDEGVPAQRTPIIDHGRFVGYLTSRETAGIVGESGSNGCMRADSPLHMPIIRMTNISLEPGDYSVDELISGTKHGYYLSTNRSWSIDDRRVNFQFGTEVAWEIEEGSMTRMYKNPTYTGITPEFWGSCDGVADKHSWHIWGVPNCGKGEPMQTMHVGHGAAPARFRQVKVGVGQW
jgi:TldD protein